jgi:hypothetical protein
MADRSPVRRFLIFVFLSPLAAASCSQSATTDAPAGSSDAATPDDDGGPETDDAGDQGEAGTVDAPGDAKKQDSAPPPSCPGQQTRCSGACVDTSSDNANCGHCGGACNGLETCFYSACTIVPAQMPTARSALAVTAGADGRVYAVGGWNGTSQSYASVEVYQPATNTWATGAAMPTARNALAAATGKDGRIYVVGGAAANNAPPLATLEIYDPAQDMWTTGASMPTPRTGLGAALGSDGRIYAIGGNNNLGFGGSTVSYAVVEAYDPTQNTWAAAASLPQAATVIGATVGKDARIYVVAGGVAYAYDATLGQWSTLPAPSDPMSLAAVIAGPDGLIYVIGGEQGLNVWALVHTYDPIGKAWALNSGLGTARDLLGAAVGSDGRIYAIGGYTGAGVLRTTEAYTPGGPTGWVP